MNRRETRSLVVNFDGASQGNPGPGSCAALCKDTKTGENIWAEKRVLGVVTSNQAEYHGLILALHCILRDLNYFASSAPLNLTIQGDSELVVRQVNGNYETNAPQLQLLRTVVVGLWAKISAKCKLVGGGLALVHVNRNKNAEADALANSALGTITDEKLVFYPNLMDMIPIQVGGVSTVCANDFGSAALTPQVLVDSAFVLQLPVMGKKAIKELNPRKETLLRGKSDCTILGALSEPVEITLNMVNPSRNMTIIITDAFVVDYLPVPVMLSFDHPQVKAAVTKQNGSFEFEKIKFGVQSVPTPYQSHPYWTSDTIWMPFLH